LLVGILGFAAPFGTTILGGVAISQIRYSRGRLYGLGLALVDALLYPLLALDILIGFACYALFHLLRYAIWTQSSPSAVWRFIADSPGCEHILPVLIVLISLVVDRIVFKRVWRMINRPLT
jgi:hypothetical protein